MKASEIISVDSLTRQRPHIRHRAVVNKVRRPYANKGHVRVLDSELAITICGRMLSSFADASDTGLNKSDGDVYAEQCIPCFEVQR